MRSPSSRHRVVGPMGVAAIWFAAAISGCSSSSNSIETLPVRGRVTLDGKSAPGASVWLLPADQQHDVSAAPRYLVGGQANAEGEFELMTNGVHSGAPPGKYLVAVTWPDPKVERDREGDRRGKDLMPPKVRDPRTSGLEFEVRADQAEPRQLNLSITER